MTEKEGANQRLFIYSVLATVMTLAALFHGVVFQRSDLVMDVLIPASFLGLGVMIKYGDQAYDTDSYQRRTALLLAFPGGIWLGALMAVDLGSATIFVGILVALLMAGKLDTLAFRIGAIVAIIIEAAALLTGFGTIDPVGVIMIIVFAFIDERVNDLPWVDNGRGWMAMLFHNRPFLKVAVLALCLVGFLPSLLYFFAFMAFDLGYSAVEAHSLRRGAVAVG
ncbi:MAG: hypothetical protein SA339_04695 [Methanomassiliicoccus sp.]|nr:hypothetical protein [Methanomassiliicoccus sp.]